MLKVKTQMWRDYRWKSFNFFIQFYERYEEAVLVLHNSTQS